MFKPHAAASTGSKFVFHDSMDPKYFTGEVPDRATTIVVSAQTVSKEFLAAWRETLRQEPKLMLIRRGTSLGSIDLDAAKELGIAVVNTPGVNSPHVASFLVKTLGLSEPLADPHAVKAVVVGSGSVGGFVIEMMKNVGVRPNVVSRAPHSPSLEAALEGATHVAVCAATSSEPIIRAEHIVALFAGDERSMPIKICSVSRPEAFSLEAIMLVTQHSDRALLRFDYGDTILAPTRDKVNRDSVKENVTWSSKAMASEACKQDMDEAVLHILGQSV